MKYRCMGCGARLEVRVPFKGRLVWSIDESDPDFSAAFPEPRGKLRHSKAGVFGGPVARDWFPSHRRLCRAESSVKGLGLAAAPRMGLPCEHGGILSGQLSSR